MSTLGINLEMPEGGFLGPTWGGSLWAPSASPLSQVVPWRVHLGGFPFAITLWESLVDSHVGACRCVFVFVCVRVCVYVYVCVRVGVLRCG